MHHLWVKKSFVCVKTYLIQRSLSSTLGEMRVPTAGSLVHAAVVTEGVG